MCVCGHVPATRGIYRDSCAYFSVVYLSSSTVVVTLPRNSLRLAIRLQQVKNPYSANGGPEVDDAHLRIFDTVDAYHALETLRSASTQTSNPTDSRRVAVPSEPGRRQLGVKADQTEISIVVVGGTVSLIGNSSSSADVGSIAPMRGKSSPQHAPFPLQDLVLLGGRLALRGRGAKVSRSARVRMGTLSWDSSDGGATWPTDTNSTSYDDASPSLSIEVTGKTLLGEAWKPKPFFLGTWLSQIFASPISEAAELFSASTKNTSPEGFVPALRERALGDDDVVMSDGVDLLLGGETLVRGEVRLAGSAVMKVRALAP